MSLCLALGWPRLKRPSTKRQPRPPAKDHGVSRFEASKWDLMPCRRANLALISTPGDYAVAEAMKALQLGLNVMLFSDNVPIEDEVALKITRKAHGLIVMGPDCGTAIVGGIPLGFANVVRRGGIGVVGASGTGLQQVTCLIDRFGEGISHAIGTGGHDLQARSAASRCCKGSKLLPRDAATKVIVLISKPPGREVAKHVLAALEKRESRWW